MSWQAMEAVQDHSITRGNERLAMLAVARYASATGYVGSGHKTPSLSTLADKAGVHRNSIRPILDRLVAAGELAILPQNERVFHYQINLPIVTTTEKLSQPKSVTTEQTKVVTVPNELAQSTGVTTRQSELSQVLEKLSQFEQKLAQFDEKLSQPKSVTVTELVTELDTELKEEEDAFAPQTVPPSVLATNSLNDVSFPMPANDQERQTFNSPAFQRWLQAFPDEWPGYVGGEEIAANFEPQFSAETVRAARALWNQCQYNPSNYAGIADFYRNLRQNPNWKPSKLQPQKPTKPSRLDDIFAAIDEVADAMEQNNGNYGNPQNRSQTPVRSLSAYASYAAN